MDFHFLAILGIWVVLAIVYSKLFNLFTKHKDKEPVDLFDEPTELYVMTAIMAILFVILPMIYSMYIIPE